MAVLDFGAKVLSGEETSPEEWQQHLREVHRRLPGVTSAVFSRHATLEGETSYQVLADAAVVGARGRERPVDVLDLACGDGYLIEVCLRKLAGSIETVTGVDISEGELELARRRLAGQNVRLHVGLAQALPLTAESVDVVLCHAAFMLMVPVAPVVAELARVLRSGGSFSAVVGSTSARASAAAVPELEAQRLLWTRIGAELRQFWDAEYPRLQPAAARLGDPRASTLDGWKELFRPETGFTGAVELHDLEIVIRESADGLWDFFSETYLVDLLDAKMREQLRRRLAAVMVEHERKHGTLDMAFPLQMFSVCRR